MPTPHSRPFTSPKKETLLNGDSVSQGAVYMYLSRLRGWMDNGPFLERLIEAANKDPAVAEFPEGEHDLLKSGNFLVRTEGSSCYLLKDAAAIIRNSLKKEGAKIVLCNPGNPKTQPWNEGNLVLDTTQRDKK